MALVYDRFLGNFTIKRWEPADRTDRQHSEGETNNHKSKTNKESGGQSC